MLGGLRAAAQLVSYEMAMGLSLVPVFMIAHSVTLQSIATYTVHWGPYHGPVPFIVLAPLSFVISRSVVGFTARLMARRSGESMAIA